MHAKAIAERTADTTTDEEWKAVAGFEGKVEISTHGRIKRLAKGRHRPANSLYKDRLTGGGYLAIMLTIPGRSKRKNYYVHHLVAETFLGPRPSGYEVNHIDGVKTNNRLSNLEYVTKQGNKLHACRLGLGRNRLTEAQVLEIRDRLQHQSRWSIACDFKVGWRTIDQIAKRKSYAWLPEGKRVKGMTPDILDDHFHGAALRAYLYIYATTRQFPPDSKEVRRLAHQIYEAELAERKA